MNLIIGRGISPPSVSLEEVNLHLMLFASYCQLREQFGFSIEHFEGVEEKIAKIAAFTYMLNASRNYTAIDSGVNQGYKLNYEIPCNRKFRMVVNDSMDG